MLLKISEFLNKKLKAQQNKEETEFLPAALEVVETPPSPIGRMVLWTLFILVSLALAWSILGKVDEVAVAPGKVIPVGNVKVVQAEDKGVIKSICVKDGQKVNEGELLLELDTTFTAADVARVKKEIAYYNLELDRLIAEQQELPFVPQKRADIEDKDVDFQIRLYQSRLAEYQVKLLSAHSSLRQNEASLTSAQANYHKLVSLYDIAKEKERRIEQLVSENAIATFVLFDHRAKRLELEQEIAAKTAEIAGLEWAIVQSQQAVSAIKAERNRDIATKLVEDRKQLQVYQEELKKAQEKDRLSRITAPIGGRVCQLAVHTVGGIVTSAQPLLEIVPEDTELQVEAWAANKDIGFIQQGQRAEVKVETFSFQKYGTIGAKVADISPDAVDDKEKGRVYRVLLSIDKNSFNVDNREVALTPGMSASGEIKIRQKRIIEFFLDPFRQYQSEALRER